VLLSVAGGFGCVFSFLVDPTIRGYDRISIFIACFALFALALLADRFRARLTRPRHRLEYHVALGLVLAAGMLDQVSPAFVPSYGHLKRIFTADAEFVGRIEAALPPRAMIFQLPSISFPESAGVARMDCYDPLRFYLHSRRLRWSHGAMKGRPGDRWRAWVGGQALEPMVANLAFAGFDGIHVYRPGYADRAADLEARLARLLGAGPTVVSREGEQSFFPLADYAPGCGAGIPRPSGPSGGRRP
jgi:phosphoglycerol transferase